MNSEQYGRYTVREAAIRLGISEGAVRQRIHRHTLVAERSDGIVYVILADDTPSHTVDSTAYETVTHTVSHTPDDTVDSTTIMLAARQQFEAIRDEWLQPLVTRIGELEREAGRLEESRDIAQQRAQELEVERNHVAEEREALRSRLSELEAAATESATSEPETPQRVWWQFWKR